MANKEKKDLRNVFKDLTIIFSSVVCFGVAIALIVLAIMAVSSKTPNWTVFWIYIGAAVLEVIWLVIFLAFIGMNKKHLVVGILNLIFAGIIGGIFFFFWKPNPEHDPGFLEKANEDKKDNSFDSLLGVHNEE